MRSLETVQKISNFTNWRVAPAQADFANGMVIPDFEFMDFGIISE